MSFQLSEDLRQVAFQQSVQLLAQEAGLATILPADSDPARSRSAPDDRAEGAVQKIGRKLGLPLTVVGEVYADDGKGGVDVVVGVGKLDDSTAAATKQNWTSLFATTTSARDRSLRWRSDMAVNW